MQVKDFLNLFPGLCGVCSSESLDTKYNTQGQYSFWTKFWFWTLPQDHKHLRFGDRPGYFTRRRHDRDWERGILAVAFFIYILHLCWLFCTALLNQLTSAARANGPKVREYSKMLNRLAAKIITPYAYGAVRRGAWGMGHGAWEASGGPLPLLGGLKTNISAELSFLQSKLSLTFTRGAPPPFWKS